uniref:trypsin n=1 Tax=Tetraodon nigroviridis TaxID=99883 RepID=H3D7C0_TETNG
MILDFFFEIVDVATGDDEEDDEGNSDWLYELQEPGGPCNPNPCHNDGVCRQKGRKIKCDCPKPFKGKKCERGPKYCKRGLCGRGECVLSSVPPFYECRCKEPFQPPDCKTYSVCEPNPCQNGGTCVRAGNDFDCQCAPGFRGSLCQVAPNDCYIGDGESYRGTVSETSNGDECLQWNSHFIIENGVNPFTSFQNKGRYHLRKMSHALNLCCMHLNSEPNKDMQVVIGGLSLDMDEPTEQTIRVEEVILHENYLETQSAVYNDISLLRLRNNDGVCAVETQFVKSACLPDGQLPDGLECTISGWGATEESGFGSNHLLKANVLLINQQKCSEPTVYGNILDVSMLCAGHLQGGVDSCQGDSGGPLTCSQNATSYVYGLVSWGDQCGKKNKPGVYTRVVQFVNWIKSKIQAP